MRPIHKWENRSVSCEVELDPGTYEVLPKVTATRRPGVKPVEDVVKEYAEKNPQKLRQVGMQFDQAHAKGGVVDEDDVIEKKQADEKKKKEKKKRKEKAEKQKQKAIAKAAKAVEKAAEAMKEAVKVDLKTQDTKGEKEEEKKEDQKTASTIESKDSAQIESGAPEQGKSEKSGPLSPDMPQGTISGGPQNQASSIVPTEKTGESPVPPPTEDRSSAEDSSPGEQAVDTPEETMKGEEEASDHHSDSDSEDSDDEDEADGANDGPVWNAVCVLGLRVYAKHPDVGIKIVEATEENESTALTIDGAPAGATT